MIRQNDKEFLLTSKFCTLGAYAPALGLYTCTSKKVFEYLTGTMFAFTGPLSSGLSSICINRIRLTIARPLRFLQIRSQIKSRILQIL